MLVRNYWLKHLLLVFVMWLPCWYVSCPSTVPWVRLRPFKIFLKPKATPHRARQSFTWFRTTGHTVFHRTVHSSPLCLSLHGAHARTYLTRERGLERRCWRFKSGKSLGSISICQRHFCPCDRTASNKHASSLITTKFCGPQHEVSRRRQLVVFQWGASGGGA